VNKYVCWLELLLSRELVLSQCQFGFERCGLSITVQLNINIRYSFRDSFFTIILLGKLRKSIIVFLLNCHLYRYDKLQSKNSKVKFKISLHINLTFSCVWSCITHFVIKKTCSTVADDTSATLLIFASEAMHPTFKLFIQLSFISHRGNKEKFNSTQNLTWWYFLYLFYSYYPISISIQCICSLKTKVAVQMCIIVFVVWELFCIVSSLITNLAVY
jgi:hypothetical protein